MGICGNKTDQSQFKVLLLWRSPFGLEPNEREEDGWQLLSFSARWCARERDGGCKQIEAKLNN